MKFFSGIRPKVLSLVTLAALLLLAQSALYGQSTGNVTGVVADTTGAVIPKAAVSLVDLQTGTKRTTTSNGSGAFAFGGVTPGESYRLDVTAENFEPWETQVFAVRAGDNLGFTDIRMKVGAANASVTVEAQIDSNLAALDTGERSDIITAEELNNLTVVGRDATELVRMLPGYAMSTGDQGLFNRPGYNTAVVGLSGPTGAFSANGAGVTGLATVTDGVSLTDIASNSGSVQQINIEMVQDVKATSSSFGAATAKGPAVISANSKRGGSVFHGEGYLAARDSVLNSNDWYDNYLRQSRPDGRYLYPGAQIGGPLWLPFTDFNHNRDKLFFFAAFEYYNQVFEANQQAISAWVPTMAERQGDFSEASLDAELCGGRPDGAQNPNSILAMCNTNNYYPDGTSIANGNTRPFVNSSGAALVNWFPEPNADPFTNPFGYNYIQQLQQTQNGEQFKATLEYDIDKSNNLFFVYGLQKEVDQDPVALGSFPSGSVPYPGDVSTGDISNVLSARYNRFISASVSNEFDAAMSFVSLPGKMGNPLAAQRFDMNSYNGGNGNFNYFGMYKNTGDFSVPSISSGGSNGYPNVLMPGGFYTNSIHTKKVDPILQDNLSWGLKNHFLQFGVYWETGTYNGIADTGGAYPQGQYNFNAYAFSSSANFEPYNGCTNPNPAGTLRNSGANYLGGCFNPTALMFEGYANEFKQTNFTPVVDMRYTTLSGFVNDQVKLHNLTLILGARIEHFGPWTDRHNNGLATFSDSLYTQECGGYTRTCESLGSPGLTWLSQKSGVSNSVNSPQTVYFTPRVGAAWDVFGKKNTVLRGGWGIYRNQEQFNPYALAAATAQGYETTDITGKLSFSQIDNTSPVNPPDFTAYTLSKTDTDRPMYYQFNGGIDQAIPGSKFLHFGPSHLSVAYVGSHNVNLGSYSNSSSYNSASDVNIICGIETGCPANNNPAMVASSTPDSLLGLSPTYPGLCTFQGGALCINNGFSTYPVISNLDTAEQDFYRPYPFYQHIYQLKHNSYSNYSSLQAVWEKQAGRWVTYGANYTFAKNLATAASWNNNIVDPVHLRNDYNPVPYDRTHVFNIHYMVNLGKLYKGGSRILSEAANDWRVTGVSQVMSGYPIASENGENFGFGYGTITPVTVPYVSESAPETDASCRTTYNVAPPCVTSMNPVAWLGSPDILLMPTVKGKLLGGPNKHQFINPLAFGLPLPGSNGEYRLPYIHGPAYLDNDVTLLKNFAIKEGQTLQLRMAAFNVFNHPLVSFNNNDTTNLQLTFQNATAGAPLTSNVLQHQDFGVANIKVGSRLVEVQAKWSF
jgi:hypothetical protein